MYRICIIIFLLLPFRLYAIKASINDAPIKSSYIINCTFNEDKSIDCINEEQFLILKSNGKDILSSLNYDFDDLKQFQLLEVRYQNLGGVVKYLDRKYIQEKNISNSRWLDNKKRVTLVFPELKVGSKLKVKYKEHMNAVSFNSKATWSHTFWNSNQYIEHYYIYIKSDVPIYYYTRNFDNFSIRYSDDRKSILISLKEPQYQYYINEPFSYFRHPPRVMVSQSSSLSDYYFGLAKYYNEISNQSLPVKVGGYVDSIRGLPKLVQVYKVLEYIYQNYRYVGDWQTNIRGWVPFNLSQIEEHGYGDCKDLSILVTAMLNNLGIYARPVFVFRGINPLPILGMGNDMINHSIVKAVVGDRVLWLDPTNYFYEDGIPHYDISSRWAIIINNDNTALLDFIPSEQRDVFISDVVIDFYNGNPYLSVTNIEKGIRVKQFRDVQINNGLYAFKDFYCNNFFYLVGDQCKLIFPRIDFNVDKDYIFRISGEDLKVLSPLSSNKYFYNDINNFFGFIDVIQRYIKNNQTLDLMMDVILKKKSIRLNNMSLLDNIRTCKVSSPWVDIEIKGDKVAKGYAINYMVDIKKKWLSRSEIMSSRFQDTLSKLIDCSKEANFIVQKYKNLRVSKGLL